MFYLSENKVGGSLTKTDLLTLSKKIMVVLCWENRP